MEKKLEIVQVGNVTAFSGDETSIKVIWNNITGDNFTTRFDHMVYLESVIFSSGIERKKFFLMEEGKCIGECGHFDLVAFPKVRKFEDLFTLIGEEPKVSPQNMGEHWTANRIANQAKGIMEFQGLSVQCSDQLIKYIEENMIYGLSGDMYYFDNILDEDSGMIRIYLKYNKILGSRLIGYISAVSLPNFSFTSVEDTVPTKKVEKEIVNTEPNIDDVIKKCSITDNVVMLPEIKLDKKLYGQVKHRLENIGGKWNTKKAGFVFDKNTDVETLMGRVKAGEKVNIKQEFQFFATPLEIAKKMVELAEIKKTDTILEPSAGDGAIYKLLLETGADVDAVEFMEQNYLKILDIEGARKFAISHSDFLQLLGTGCYDKIVANPPFTKNQDIDHVRHMYTHLAPKGRIVTIMSQSWLIGSQKKQIAFREWLNEIDATVEKIEAGEFKESGTNVATTLVIINKPE